jgi:hypothetical protein
MSSPPLNSSLRRVGILRPVSAIAVNSKKGNAFSTGQEICCFLRNPRSQCRIQDRLPPVHILSHAVPVHSLRDLFNIRFNICSLQWFIAWWSQWPRGLGMNCFRPLKHWSRGFESHFRHEYFSTFILFVLSCVVSGVVTGWSPAQIVLPTVYIQLGNCKNQRPLQPTE